MTFTDRILAWLEAHDLRTLKHSHQPVQDGDGLYRCVMCKTELESDIEMERRTR